VADAVNGLRVEWQLVDPARGAWALVRSASDPTLPPYQVKAVRVGDRLEVSCSCFNGSEIHPAVPRCHHAAIVRRQLPGPLRRLRGWKP